MKHANVALFIPHNGCPNQCSFCNQNSITGSSSQPTIDEIESTIKDAINNLGEKTKDAEIAFFGGSFTAINKDYMKELLKVAFKYVKDNVFLGIRISTRPDAINDDILKTLKNYGVTAIELGAQSMDDNVLKLNKRGHTSNDVIVASKMIKEYGFSLGLQMMTGLYGSTIERDYITGKIIASLNPNTVRIYPTVIMKNTFLEELYNKGKYITHSFDDTIDLCSRLLLLFESNNIPVIRLGLHDMKTLHEDMVGGVWHPAFRELCESNIMFKKCILYLERNNAKGKNIEICVNNKCVSKMIGQKRSNLLKLNNMGYKVKIKQDKNVKINDINIRICG